LQYLHHKFTVFQGKSVNPNPGKGGGAWCFGDLVVPFWGITYCLEADLWIQLCRC